MLSATIGALLRGARTAQGMSRADLAERAGVSVRLVAELERGARPNVSLETALLLLQVLGIALRPVKVADDRPMDVPGRRHADIEQQEREARSAWRRATWVGAVGARSTMRPPRPPSSIAARLSAVSQASTLASALARSAERAAPAATVDSERAAKRVRPKIVRTTANRSP